MVYDNNSIKHSWAENSRKYNYYLSDLSQNCQHQQKVQSKVSHVWPSNILPHNLQESKAILVACKRMWSDTKIPLSWTMLTYFCKINPHGRQTRGKKYCWSLWQKKNCQRHSQTALPWGLGKHPRICFQCRCQGTARASYFVRTGSWEVMARQWPPGDGVVPWAS